MRANSYKHHVLCRVVNDSLYKLSEEFHQHWNNLIVDISEESYQLITKQHTFTTQWASGRLKDIVWTLWDQLLTVFQPSLMKFQRTCIITLKNIMIWKVDLSKNFQSQNSHENFLSHLMQSNALL